MGKVKLAEEKKKMARVDTHAAKRFVRNALWTAPPSTSTAADESETTSRDDTAETEMEPPAAKRVKQCDNRTDPDIEPETQPDPQPDNPPEKSKKSKKKKSKKEKKKKKEHKGDSD